MSTSAVIRSDECWGSHDYVHQVKGSDLTILWLQSFIFARRLGWG